MAFGRHFSEHSYRGPLEMTFLVRPPSRRASLSILDIHFMDLGRDHTMNGVWQMEVHRDGYLSSSLVSFSTLFHF